MGSYTTSKHYPHAISSYLTSFPLQAKLQPIPELSGWDIQAWHMYVTLQELDPIWARGVVFDLSKWSIPGGELPPTTSDRITTSLPTPCNLPTYTYH